MTTPEIIYHYTGVEGLHGILKDNQIRATSYRFMSDPQEFNYGFDLFSELFPKNSSDAFFTEIIKQWQPVYDYDVLFLASFSKDGDSLGQWRGYAGLHSGYSLGFSVEGLKSAEETRLIDCCYNKQQQIEEITNIINKYLPTARLIISSIDHNPVDLLALAAEAQKELVSLFPRLKDKAFDKEEEWRLVVGPLSGNDSRICYRTKERVIIPYFIIDYRDKGLPIKKIIVGPGPHKQRGVKSLHQMLAVKKISGVEVIPSKVPFRTW